MNTKKKNANFNNTQIIKLDIEDSASKPFSYINNEEEIYQRQRNMRSFKVYQHTYITQHKGKDDDNITNGFEITCSDDSCDETNENSKIFKIKRNFQINSEIDNIFKDVYSFWFDPKCSGKAATQPYNCTLETVDFLYIFTTSVYKNITDTIKKQKERIYLNLPNTIGVKEKYCTIKNQILAELSVGMLPEEDKRNIIQKHTNEIAAFCEEYKTDIHALIKALLKVYAGYLSSANMLEHIFGRHIKLLCKFMKEEFTFMDLHTEEFFTTIYTKDDFLKSMIIEVKQREISEFLELRVDIEKIETEINSCKKIMKKIKEFTEKNCKIYMEEISEVNEDFKYDVNILNDFLIQTAK
jgi:hypothetical protein